MAREFSRVPPASRSAVIPEARSGWQPILMCAELGRAALDHPPSVVGAVPVERRGLYMEIGSNGLRYFGNICISGLTAAGKTTHSHLLSGEFGLTYISGSQIQLNLMGISPIQSREFWITQEARALWNTEQFARVDSELLRLESCRTGCVFDTSTMPWRHRKDALCIWLDSTLPSRVIKSIISHHGDGNIAVNEYTTMIEHKDRSTYSLYKSLYGIDIGTDLSPFDLVIDISNLIEQPTLRSSLASILRTHSIIRPAVAFYLTGDEQFRDEYIRMVHNNGNYVRYDKVIDARSRLVEM